MTLEEQNYEVLDYNGCCNMVYRQLIKKLIRKRMKKLLAILSVVFFANQASAGEAVEFIESFQQSINAPYRLFNTINLNTLIALETSTGKLYQIHPGIGENAAQGILVINEKDLTLEGSESESNRFTLYPTPNIFSFILVDQLDGQFWRVQWNYEKNKRFIQFLYLLE